MSHTMVYLTVISRYRDASMTTLELKIPPLALTIILAILMWSLSDQLPDATLNYVWSGVFAVSFFVSGIIFALLGVLEFRKADTTVDPRVPQHTSSLVVSGVYRLSRNPMYIGFFLILLGWALYLSDILALLLLPLFIIYMNRFQIIPEEQLMREKFGEEYVSYMSQVRRWI